MWVVAGVVVGVVVVTALAVGAVLLIRRRRNRAKLYRGVAPNSGTGAATIPPRGSAPEGWNMQSFQASYPTGTATDSSSGELGMCASTHKHAGVVHTALTACAAP